MTDLTQTLETRASWSDLTLAPAQEKQLRALAAPSRLTAKSGQAVLFTGPPGTGKTLAAQVIAGALGAGLLRVDLSAVVTKTIGETEKNLARVFAAAEEGSAVLLFDEADALFGKRTDVKDAHDRYANSSTTTLLERIEAYHGLVILSANRRANLDPAVLRRLSAVIDLTPR